MVPWTRRHLLGLEELTRQEIVTIPDAAQCDKQRTRRDSSRVDADTGDPQSGRIAHYRSGCADDFIGAETAAIDWNRCRQLKLLPTRLRHHRSGA